MEGVWKIEGRDDEKHSRYTETHTPEVAAFLSHRFLHSIRLTARDSDDPRCPENSPPSSIPWNPFFFNRLTATSTILVGSSKLSTWPLYTHPNPPSPKTDDRLKLSVAVFSWAKVKILSFRDVSASRSREFVGGEKLSAVEKLVEGRGAPREQLMISGVFMVVSIFCLDRRR